MAPETHFEKRWTQGASGISPWSSLHSPYPSTLTSFPTASHLPGYELAAVPSMPLVPHERNSYSTMPSMDLAYSWPSNLYDENSRVRRASLPQPHLSGAFAPLSMPGHARHPLPTQPAMFDSHHPPSTAQVPQHLPSTSISSVGLRNSALYADGYYRTLSETPPPVPNTEDSQSSDMSISWLPPSHGPARHAKLEQGQVKPPKSRPFVCSRCSRAFSRKHDLERHARVHSGDRPYVCRVCKKGFPRSDALRRHIRVERDTHESYFASKTSDVLVMSERDSASMNG